MLGQALAPGWLPAESARLRVMGLVLVHWRGSEQGQWAASHLGRALALTAVQAWALKLKALAQELAPRQAHHPALELALLMIAVVRWKALGQGHVLAAKELAPGLALIQRLKWAREPVPEQAQ